MNTGYALALAAHGDGWGHMGNGAWSGWMWLGGVVMVLLWTAIIGGAAWLIVRATAPRRAEASGHRETGLERAREILAERYAGGEIDTEEYDERLARLG